MAAGWAPDMMLPPTDTMAGLIEALLVDRPDAETILATAAQRMGLDIIHIEPGVLDIDCLAPLSHLRAAERSKVERTFRQWLEWVAERHRIQ